MSKELKFFKDKGFQVMSQTGDNSWFNLIKDYGDYLIGAVLDLNKGTYTLRHTIDMSMHLEYSELGTHLLKDTTFDHAISKLEQVAEHLCQIEIQ